jgi:anthranilate phosphoribosyltransferase
VLDPAELGIARADVGALRGADAAYNAGVVRSVFAGDAGPVRDAVLLNSAAALAAYDPVDKPLVERLGHGIERAAAAIDSGAATHTLEHWVTVTQGLAATR